MRTSPWLLPLALAVLFASCRSDAGPTAPEDSPGTLSLAGHRKWVVDDDGRPCKKRDFADVQSAVNAAQPGDEIQVCAGLYNQIVHVDRALRFKGAHDPTGEDCLAAPDPSRHAIVVGSFNVNGVEVEIEHMVLGSLRVTDGVLTVRKSHLRDLGGDGSGIDVRDNCFVGGGANAIDVTTVTGDVEKNVFLGYPYAVHLTDAEGVVIRDNRVEESGGLAAFLASQDVEISHNDYSRGSHPAAGPAIAGEITDGVIEKNDLRGPALAIELDLSDRVVVRENDVTEAGALAALLDSHAVELSHNRYSGEGAASAASAAVLIDDPAHVGGGEHVVADNELTGLVNRGVAIEDGQGHRVERNTIEGGSIGIQSLGGFDLVIEKNRLSDMFLGISLSLETGAADVFDNDVRDVARGIVASGGFKRIRKNRVENASEVGIGATVTSHDLRFEENHAKGSGVWDCEDPSAGGGTAGTANTWVRNRGRLSSPGGICRK